MSIIARIEDEMITALRDALPSAALIAAFPDDARDFDLAQYELAVLVHYAGARYEAQGLSGPADQMRDLRFALLIYVRGLRGPAGSYETLEAARKAVQNRRFAGSAPVRLIAERLAGEEAGIWQWEMEVSVPMLAVAAHVTPRTGGPMQFTQGENG